MNLTVYTFFKPYLGCYDQPLYAREPIESVVEGYRRQVLTDPDTAYKYKFQESQICVLGTFDDFNGTFDLLPNPQKVADCSTFFPAGYLLKKGLNGLDDE